MTVTWPFTFIRDRIISKKVNRLILLHGGKYYIRKIHSENS